jgi:type III secretory pathway component EscU
MNKTAILRLLSVVVAMFGIAMVSAYILMLILVGWGISFPYLAILGMYCGTVAVILLTKLGKSIWDYLIMLFTMFVAKRKLRKDLAEQQDILKKHFKMFSGDKNG